MPSAFILLHLFLLSKCSAGLFVKSTSRVKIRGALFLCLSPLIQVTALADCRGLEAFCMYLPAPGPCNEGGKISPTCSDAFVVL